MKTKGSDFVLGVDYGTDSARAVIVDAADGSFVGSGVSAYRRWAEGTYCDASTNSFRQHPLDYIESLEASVSAALAVAGSEIAGRIRGLSIDTTGSTPCFADASGKPLSLTPAFAENPDAMFILWKDHTGLAEAARVNTLARSWGGVDFTRYEGGIYSSEWFWAKALHVVSTNSSVSASARTIVEHCDWMPALLSGSTDPAAWKRSRCAAGHKALWHASWGGYPDKAFISLLHPRLAELLPSLGTETWTAETEFGKLCPEWAARLGLPVGISVGVGSFDAHVGAIGGGVAPGTLLKIMGTSTCDIMLGPLPATPGAEKTVRGICGQVDGSVMSGMIGYEAGQSAFGDVFAWFRDLLSWPLRAIPSIVPKGNARGSLDISRRALEDVILPALEAAALGIDPGKSGVLALDWLNGRRTPDADQGLKGALTGLTLGTDAPAIYRALVEAAAFGSRAIVERMREEGLVIERVAAVGGVAKKSSLVMQISADVLGLEIAVQEGDQSVALGAAMLASVVAGLYDRLPAAQAAMGARVEKTWKPDPARHAVYDRLYAEYRALGAFVETATKAAKS